LLGQAAQAGRNFVGRVIDFIKSLPGKVWQWLVDTISRVGIFHLQVVAKAGAAARGFVEGIVNRVKALPGDIWRWLTKVISDIGRWGSNLLSAAGRAARNFVNGFLNAIRSLPGRLADFIRSAIANIQLPFGIKLPSFDVGAWKLPTDMVAMVHKGEMIVPEDIASRLRGERHGGFVSSPSFGVPDGRAVGGSLTINNYYGPSSVRSSEDIRRISEEQAERMRLMGLTLTGRTTGTIA
jgi:hypothetical protein